METVLDFRPQIVHLKLYSGGIATLQIPLLDSKGAPLDLSAVTMLMQIKRLPSDSDKVKELTNGQGLTGSADSIIEAKIPVDFPVGTYVSDLFMTISGELIPVVKWIITVEPNVSR